MTVIDKPLPISVNSQKHNDMANSLRALAMDMVQRANSGHPGMPMGAADMATVLFSKFLKFNPRNPKWADRDRFVLSAGHGSALLYGLLHLTGYEKMTIEELKNFRQLHSLTPGHPEVMQDIGIETTTGPLGQGVATAVGMAMAERITAARFGDDIIDHHTYVICSDGDLMEGVSHEAASMAGHLKLKKLIMLYDDNHICIDGSTDTSFSDDTGKRFEAYNWDVQHIDGHDAAAIENAISAAQKTETPSLICCRTIIGLGSPSKSNSSAAHGSPLGEEEIIKTKKALGWDYAAFEIPDSIRTDWQKVGKKHIDIESSWQDRLKESGFKKEFESAFSGELKGLDEAILEAKKHFLKEKPNRATRQCSGDVLEHLVPALPSLIGGSADLTGSNNTYVKGTNSITADDFSGRYIHYGVREFGMAAAMNGMALHGGIMPYSGTFLVFSDYSRPAIRLAALMKTPLVHVLTHDSIGLGEDGPTHQPVEHMAALRAIPNLYAMRPCDGVETAECWQLALGTKTTPTALALTRQALPSLRIDETSENLSAKGAYILREASKKEPQVIIIATGSEVHLAVEAREELEKENIATRVVSMPCWEAFEAQSAEYRDMVIPKNIGAIRIGIEAAIRQGWDRWLGDDGIFIGMNGFGDSAPAPELFEYFGITTKAIIDAAKSRL